MTAPISLRLAFLPLMVAVLLPRVAQAEQPDAVLVSRGEHVLTLGDMDARMSRFPAHERAQFAHNPENIGRLMDRLLIDSQLAEQARELGIDQRPEVRRDLELAVREVLAIHRMNRLFEPDQMPDFRLLARERYLADPASQVQPERLVVEHVLVKTETRDEAQAQALAERIRDQARRDPAAFATLVREHSEDPSSADNNGRFVIEDTAQFVPEFVAAAQTLANADQISEPVRTQFGYHVLRLVERVPARALAFEEVEAALIRGAELNYLETARTDFLAELRGRHPETGDEALLRSLPARYGGRPEQPGGAN
ncbi:MAG: peptidylprolyl isomerase [Xanthomonadales bacterium]|nr:peptidylprolyl isomerase [Xanthomonadales bacterium]